jgi:prepilin-type N-terminal cleavage/methylation domain-containing protein
VKNRRSKAGFTLIEVIVVIVIIAILAAIGVPALTGYIDKAQDKKYIAQAHDAMVAVRTVWDEAYGDGTLGAMLPDANSDYLTNGNTYTNMKSFSAFFLSAWDTGTSEAGAGVDYFMYYRKASELTGIPYQATPVAGTSNFPGFWMIEFLSPKSSDYNILSAPAFSYYVFPDGWGDNKPCIFVTYMVSGIPDSVTTRAEYEAALASTGVYDPNAGYKVYEVTQVYS